MGWWTWTLKILAVMFWGMMKAFFWQSLKQAKSSGGMGWNSRGLASPLCLVMLFEESKPPSSLHYAAQVFVSEPNFGAKYILRLWLVGHFPTRCWFDSGCGVIRLRNVWNVLHVDFHSSIQDVDSFVTRSRSFHSLLVGREMRKEVWHNKRLNKKHRAVNPCFKIRRSWREGHEFSGLISSWIHF